MKKLFLLLFCGLLFAAILPLQAKKVEPERAEKVAQGYIESKRELRGKSAGLRLEHAVTQKHELPTGATRMQRSSSSPSAQDTLFYYVFNVDETAGGGFVIVSGDDAVKPVLGYSDNGNYDENNLPPNFAAWMNELQRQIAYAQSQNLPQSETLQNEWESYLTGNISFSTRAAGPLIQTQWN